MNLGPGGDGGGGLAVGEFVSENRILYGKLVGSLLGAVWLTLVGGWITVVQAIASVHVQLLEAAQTFYVRGITAILGGGADVIRYSWAAAYQDAVAASPVLAPLLMLGEIMVVLAIFIPLRRRLL